MGLEPREIVDIHIYITPKIKAALKLWTLEGHRQ